MRCDATLWRAVAVVRWRLLQIARATPSLTVWIDHCRASQHKLKGHMMDHAYGWMGGGMWLWTVIAALVVILLVMLINKVSKKQ